MRRRIVAANWKMHKTAEQTVQFFAQVRPLVKHALQCEIVVFPAAVNIQAAVRATVGFPIQIGGQNLFWAREGPYTGEVSGEMLRAIGARWVIIGHSERRHFFHEREPELLKKTRAAVEADLIPIVCLGERSRDSGHCEELVRQASSFVAGMTEREFSKLVIAYEPIWAIGTGESATPQAASRAHQIIRAEARMRFGNAADTGLRILYGGSVTSENVGELMREPEVDGVLVGSASLDPRSFAKIVGAA